ncbi:MAG TPA: maleylpyruvate isomerase N-terminal domain-containing protein [Actinomycetota bacterium]|nr:maleylpyruvate isomerase N-terminal domain-containing protein [Actinomycetota bacterium]
MAPSTVIDIRELVVAERTSWEQFQSLIGALGPEQLLQPGYFEEGWSAKDLLAHVAGWLAEAVLVLEQMRAGTYIGTDMDIDAMNAVFLEANKPEPFTIVATEAHASRTRLLQEVQLLEGVTEQAAVWLRKAGPEHYAEHLPRLREWVKELRG